MILFKKIYFYLLRYFNISHKKCPTEYGDIYLDFQNDGISQQLFYYKTRESDKVSIIKNLLQPGDGVIDCGSNIGAYPVLEGNLVGDNGYVVCIEPDPRNILTLKKNISLLNTKTQLIEKAIGKKNFITQINLNTKTNITRLFNIKNPYKKLGGFEKKNIHSVNVISFQSLLDLVNFDLKKIKLLRMDIEGGEIDVLHSLSKTLDKIPNLQILFETHPDFYTIETLQETLETFFKNGYRFKKLISSGSFTLDFLNKYNLEIKKELISDGFKRYLFENISNETSIELINHKKPKLIRYVLLSK